MNGTTQTSATSARTSRESGFLKPGASTAPHQPADQQERSAAAKKRTLDDPEYWVVWAFATVIGVVLFLSSYDGLMRALPGNNLSGDVRDFVHHVATGSGCMLADIQRFFFSGFGCIATAGPETAPQSHTTTVTTGVLQIVGVIAVSLLWFLTFKRHVAQPSRSYYTIASGIPTLAYVGGMFNAYQPAVFVAALVAIYVAAEHYGELSLHGEHLSTQEKALAKMDDYVGSISSTIKLNFNQKGLRIFEKEVFGAYSRAKTIYAVIRDHKIEEVWWAHAKQEFAKDKTLTEVWTWYESGARQDGEQESQLTLFTALTQDRDKQHEGGISAAYFVTYMPMPATHEWDTRDNKAGLFEDLLGLAWECVLLKRVRSKLAENRTADRLPLDDSVNEWVSTALCWAHATDKEVFQVIKRKNLENSTVVKTASLDDADASRLDADMSKKIIDSTQAEIGRYVPRGVKAEEYLCAVLNYAYIDAPGKDLLTSDRTARHNNIVHGLKNLEFDEWMGAHESTTEYGKKVLENICVEIFAEFMQMCRDKPVTAGAPSAARPGNSLFLAQEVL